MKGLAAGKSPGIDGLPVEFYAAFWDELGPCLLKESPQSCRRAVVTLLPKKGDLRCIGNWRPMSLLCADYKIFAKVLANRLKEVVGQLVQPEQAYCVPGRCIYNNIGMVRDVISLAVMYDMDAGLLFMGQEKAFDRVSHEYLRKLLLSFGFGQNFTAHVHLLYTGISSLIKINQRLGCPVPVTGGVRQGCPLSGLLYTLSLEPRLRRLRNTLSGFKVPGPENAVIKLSAYADDVCAAINDAQDVSALCRAVGVDEKASCAKVNWRKCEALCLGSQGAVSSVLLPGRVTWQGEGVKYLGVYLGKPQVAQKNWTEMGDIFEAKLRAWARLAPQMSFRGRVLVGNNLAASVLWHRAKVLQAPGWLLTRANRSLVHFVWNGKHWMRPGVLCLPVGEGGQGLVDVTARVMSCRLQALALLRNAGGRLGYGRELFLMDLARVDCRRLPEPIGGVAEP